MILFPGLAQIENREFYFSSPGIQHVLKTDKNNDGKNYRTCLIKFNRLPDLPDNVRSKAEMEILYRYCVNTTFAELLSFLYLYERNFLALG